MCRSLANGGRRCGKSYSPVINTGKVEKTISRLNKLPPKNPNNALKQAVQQAVRYTHLIRGQLNKLDHNQETIINNIKDPEVKINIDGEEVTFTKSSTTPRVEREKLQENLTPEQYSEVVTKTGWSTKQFKETFPELAETLKKEGDERFVTFNKEGDKGVDPDNPYILYTRETSEYDDAVSSISSQELLEAVLKSTETKRREYNKLDKELSEALIEKLPEGQEIDAYGAYHGEVTVSTTYGTAKEQKELADNYIKTLNEEEANKVMEMIDENVKTERVNTAKAKKLNPEAVAESMSESRTKVSRESDSTGKKTL